MTARALVAALLSALSAVALVGALLAGESFWYRVVVPPIGENLVQARGTLAQVSGECPNVKGGSAFTLRIHGQEELSFSQHCGRRLRDELAGSVGSEVVAVYRLERDVLFWVRPRLYGLQSSKQVFVERREHSSALVAAAGSLLGIGVCGLAAWYAARGVKRVCGVGVRDAPHGER